VADMPVEADVQAVINSVTSSGAVRSSSSAQSSDAVVNMAARLRERALNTVRSAVTELITAWTSASTGMSATSAQPSLAASLLTVSTEGGRVSVTEVGPVAMSLFDRTVLEAPNGETVTLTKGEIAGVVIGSLIGASLLAGGIAWLSYRAGSKHAYEQISQNAASSSSSSSSEQQQQQQQQPQPGQSVEAPKTDTETPASASAPVQTTQIEMVEV